MGQAAVLIMLMLFVLSVALFTPLSVSLAVMQKDGGAQSATYEKRWADTVFKEIDERANAGKLAKLRTAVLRKDDLELRVWIGFGPAALEGFVIERQSNRWSAMHLRSISPQVVRVDLPKKLAAPESGWEAFWQRLTSEGVLTLPDSGPAFSFVDSEAFVVEIRTGRSYRTYMYDTHSETPEAKRMTRIVQTIREELKVPR